MVHEVKVVANALPALVVFTLSMRGQIVFSLKPFRAFNAVPLAQAWQVLRRLCGVVLTKVLLIYKVCLDLVKISGSSRC